MTDKKNVSTILEEIETLVAEGGLIPFDKVQVWMNSSFIEVQGAVFTLLFEHSDKVKSLPSVQDLSKFYLNYLQRCLEANIEGEYVKGRYMTGHTLRAFFERLWMQKETTESILKEIRDMLAGMLRKGDPEINDTIITAILEHLFNNPEITEFFKDWENDPYLSDIYNEALYLSS